MKTSNFRNAGRLPNAVAICRATPNGWSGRRYPSLAPTWAMVKLPEGVFRSVYADQLKGLDPARVFEDLGPEAILLCWEAPGKFCHRRMVAEWLERSLGVEVPELNLAPAPVSQMEPVPTLFDYG